MKQQKILFIDRDGTLIEEPEDYQVDSLEKLAFKLGVIPALLKLKNAGYAFVIVTNQDGLGTQSFPEENFTLAQEFMLKIFSSQGIIFEAVRVCPHFLADNCDCRKPKINLVLDYVIEQKIDRDKSFVIGDRETDVLLAKNLGIQSIRFGQNATESWEEVANSILLQSQTVKVIRKTNETDISVAINLNKHDQSKINTGIGFFDHMLEQLAKHAGFELSLTVKGDLRTDDHHTVEDTAITLGEALRKIVGEKMGIARYGFVLPMDEALTSVTLDLSGRSFADINCKFERERIGELSTELIPHFFRSFAESLKATLHIDVKGENTHHMIESMFKGVGRALRQALKKSDDASLPTTKGIL